MLSALSRAAGRQLACQSPVLWLGHGKKQFLVMRHFALALIQLVFQKRLELAVPTRSIRFKCFQRTSMEGGETHTWSCARDLLRLMRVGELDPASSLSISSIRPSGAIKPSRVAAAKATFIQA